MLGEGLKSPRGTFELARLKGRQVLPRLQSVPAMSGTLGKAPKPEVFDFSVKIKERRPTKTVPHRTERETSVGRLIR
jgi:hypothetical protein